MPPEPEHESYRAYVAVAGTPPPEASEVRQGKNRRRPTDNALPVAHAKTQHKGQRFFPCGFSRSWHEKQRQRRQSPAPSLSFQSRDATRSAQPRARKRARAQARSTRIRGTPYLIHDLNAYILREHRTTVKLIFDHGESALRSGKLPRLTPINGPRFRNFHILKAIFLAIFSTDPKSISSQNLFRIRFPIATAWIWTLLFLRFTAIQNAIPPNRNGSSGPSILS